MIVSGEPTLKDLKDSERFYRSLPPFVRKPVTKDKHHPKREA